MRESIVQRDADHPTGNKNMSPPNKGPQLPRGNDSVLQLLDRPPSSAPTLEKYLVDRDDDRPLSFEGYFLGKNEIDPEDRLGTLVKIYITKSHKIITSVYQWQRSSSQERQRHRAAAHTNVEDALTWLKTDGGGKLGKASREAWEAACQTWPEFRGQDVEHID